MPELEGVTMATNKQMIEMARQMKSGKLTLDQVVASLERKKGMALLSEPIPVAKGMSDDKIYLVCNGKLVSIPLRKTRNDGGNAELTVFYATDKKSGEKHNMSIANLRKQATAGKRLEM